MRLLNKLVQELFQVGARPVEAIGKYSTNDAIVPNSVQIVNQVRAMQRRPVSAVCNASLKTIAQMGRRCPNIDCASSQIFS